MSQSRFHGFHSESPGRPGWRRHSRPRAGGRAAGARRFPRGRAPLSVRLASLGRSWSSPLPRALEELHRVQRAEVSLLLGIAAEWKLRVEGPGCSLVGAVHGPFSRRSWGRRARLLIDLCRRDATLHPGLGLLKRLTRETPAHWPSALDLASVAHDAHPSPESLLSLGNVALSLGHPEQAARVFRALARKASTRYRWRAFQALAYAHLQAGRVWLALGAMDRAADEPSSDVSAFVESLLLSRLVGDARRLDRSAARLDFLIDPEDPRFAWALGRAQGLRRFLTEPWRATWDRTVRLHRVVNVARPAPSSPAQSVLFAVS